MGRLPRRGQAISPHSVDPSAAPPTRALEARAMGTESAEGPFIGRNAYSPVRQTAPLDFTAHSHYSTILEAAAHEANVQAARAQAKRYKIGPRV